MPVASRQSWFGLLTLVLALPCLHGCSPAPTPPAGPAPAEKHDEHVHAEHGPHDGHMLKSESADHQFEWTHDDETGKVTVYVLGADKQEKPVAASQAEVLVEIGEKATKYPLTPVNPSGEPAQTAVYETTDRALLEGLKAVGHGVTAHLHLTTGETTLEAAFDHMPHDDHHHH